MKILIVDDEQLARQLLLDLLTEIDSSYELFQANNGKEAIEIYSIEQPHVVLLDIRMPVMDGLETAYHFSSLASAPAVIFTTAFQDHALEAFEANAVDYLLKPVRIERLQKALSRIEAVSLKKIMTLRDAELRPAIHQHVSVTSQGKLELIPVSEVRCFKADQKYVSVCLPGREVLTDEPLKSLESQFSRYFVRIHRNALVAIGHIESLDKNSDGNYDIKLKDIDGKLNISRRQLKNVKKVMKRRVG